MNRSKTTLAIASIMVAGALTGIALAILLQQSLPYRHQHVYGLGTPGTSVDGANGANGALGVNDNNANATIGIISHGPHGFKGEAGTNSWVFLS
jgi:hypothetical protein